MCGSFVFFVGATLDCRIPLADFSCAFSFVFDKTEFTGCEEFCSLGGATLAVFTLFTDFSTHSVLSLTKLSLLIVKSFFCGRNTPLTDVCR